ncbi:MAG: hypothetical protein IBX69_02875 [Anaerolineales bacterium]|nr:hypothetical protein [Anaerolineales bacterium]
MVNSNTLAQSNSFDELFLLIESRVGGIHGIGELYIYDTSLRIGAKLGLLPTKMYLHAGTRRGTRALGFQGETRTLEVSQLPGELQQPPPHEIEDVFCIFKDKLQAVGVDNKG